MSSWSQPIEGNGKFHLWPWEDEVISTAEYERSLQGLKNFVAKVKLTNLLSIEDLSATASLVGHDIAVVIAPKGRKIEKKSLEIGPGASEFIRSLEREYIFTRSMYGQEIVVTTGYGHTLISERRSIGFQTYQREILRIKLPLDRDIAFGNTPNVDDESLWALDLRRGSLQEYRPVKAPEDPAVQQGFTAALKDAIQDIFAVLN